MSHGMKTAAGAAALVVALLAGGRSVRAADGIEKAAAHAYVQDRLDTHMGFHCGAFKWCRGAHAAKPAPRPVSAAPQADPRRTTLAFYSAGARPAFR